MPVNVISHDTRLEGRTPATTSSTIAFEVNDETPLSDFFDRAVRIADEHNGIGTLYIMAHGVMVVSEDTTAIAFCREFISFETVHQFARLRDKVDRIVLFACHAAESTMTRHGDGDELCRHIALEAHAEVTAAREDQAYGADESCTLMFCDESALEFGEWEGPVVVYGRNGNIISEFQNPSIWRDAAGGVHDPRSEPRP
jgi:hypothetical protein